MHWYTRYIIVVVTRPRLKRKGGRLARMERVSQLRAKQILAGDFIIETRGIHCVSCISQIKHAR